MKTNCYNLKIDDELTISGTYDYEGAQKNAKIIVEYYICELVKANPELIYNTKNLIKIANKLLKENQFDITLKDLIVAHGFKADDELITTTK